MQPPATAASTGRAAKVAVGAATPLTAPKSPQRGEASSGTPVAAAAFTRTGDQAASSSYALPLLGVLALGLILGYAGVRLWRRHQRRRLEALRHERAVAWEEVIREIKMKKTLAASEPSAGRWQQIDVG
jgi:hypothetical protein